MAAIQQRTPASQIARVDLVDNWHQEWQNVLRALDKQCGRASLHVDEDGWLSARQNLLVAFVDSDVAAHVCFHVEPAQRPGKSTKRACVEARLDSYGIDPAFCGQGIERTLRAAALARANALKCKQIDGFDLKDAWC